MDRPWCSREKVRVRKTGGLHEDGFAPESCRDLPWGGESASEDSPPRGQVGGPSPPHTSGYSGLQEDGFAPESCRGPPSRGRFCCGETVTLRLGRGMRPPHQEDGCAPESWMPCSSPHRRMASRRNPAVGASPRWRLWRMASRRNPEQLAWRGQGMRPPTSDAVLGPPAGWLRAGTRVGPPCRCATPPSGLLARMRVGPCACRGLACGCLGQDGFAPE